MCSRSRDCTTSTVRIVAFAGGQVVVKAPPVFASNVTPTNVIRGPGPIVRINPRELSIRDNEYYDELYVVGSVRSTDNYDTFATGIEFEGSHFLSTGHELHRRRRRPLEPFFSRSGVRKLEPMVADVCEKLVVEKFGRLAGTGKVVRLDHAFVAFSGDIITRLCLDDPPNFVDEPDFAPEWFELFQAIIKSLPIFMSFPWLIR